MAVTGILMFFHLGVGAVKLAHEWLGWLFVIGVAAHLVVNRRPLLGYFRKPVGVGIIATVFLLGALPLFLAGGPPRHPFMEAMKALEQSSLGLVAQVVKRSPQSVMDGLKARGFHIRHEAQTIADIASDNRKPSMEVLAYIIGNVNEPSGRATER